MPGQEEDGPVLGPVTTVIVQVQPMLPGTKLDMPDKHISPSSQPSAYPDNMGLPVQCSAGGGRGGEGQQGHSQGQLLALGLTCSLWPLAHSLSRPGPLGPALTLDMVSHQVP